MERAAILIGVRKAHNLPVLEAALDGVASMKAWALGQGIPDERVITITDESEPVGIGDIKKAIRKVIALDVIEQLVVYFAGHGINVARGEYWLLSHAIIDPDEAVNLSGSEERARFATIPHVVFVSDACRTAASGIQAQGVTGGVIFDDLGATGSEQDVDLFFASSLGHPALEVPNVQDAAQSHSSVFTDTLLEALAGQHPEVIGEADDASDDVVLVRPLKPFLKRVVPPRVYTAVNRKQQPDARITSDGRWLATLSTPHVGSSAPEVLEPTALELLAHESLLNAIDDQPQSLEAVLSYAGADLSAPTEETGDAPTATFDDAARAAFAAISQRAARPADRTHFETGCGFVVSGEQVVQATMQEADTDVFDEGAFVRVHPRRRAESTLLRFASGRGAVLPAIDGFLAVLTFVNGDLVSVEYAPSANSSRWSAYSSVEEELKQLRAVIAASSAMGTFSLADEHDADRLARRMQIEKGFDPALSVYAAYAYRELGDRPRIRSMMGYQHSDLGVILFDIALLARKLEGTTLGTREEIVPFVPLLAQGWALLAASTIEIPPALRVLRGQLVSSSVWSLYEPAGVDMLRGAMLAKEVLP